MRYLNYFSSLVAIATCAASAYADPFAVYPSAISLENQTDVQRLIAVESREDGVTLDRTPDIAVTFDKEGVAKFENGAFIAVGDGEAVATVTHGDKSAAVPVKVTNAALNPEESFKNDVEPVLMKAGCNAGSCHGSASGKNGFRVSLFGFDPGLDYINLTRDNRARRMNAGSPAESLLLQKATGDVVHDGGSRFEKNTPLYDTLHKWISEGAKNDPAPPPSLTGVEILPRSAVLEGAGAQQRFVVRGLYSDGSDRDVTNLAILSSSDDLTCPLDVPTAKTTAADPGEGYIMARYGSFAVVSKVIVIPQGLTMAWPEDAKPVNYVDDFIFDKLKKLRVLPAASCDDATFVRRAYMDVLGILPTADETRSFLADTAADKRAKLIDTLLERPEFNELWAMKWADLLRVQTVPNQVDRKALNRYNDWLRNAITTNKPIDQLVRELLTAQGGNFTEPAVNFYVAEPNPLQMAENVAQVFMGIQLKCAQCHNHPFERWTMDDYYSFSAFFAQVGQKGSSDPRERIVFDRRGGEVNHIKDNRAMAPKFLGGDTPDCTGKDRRTVLADWLTAPDNPWFAKTIGNRVWAQFFGRGITDPPDDVRVTNPPTHPELEDALAKRLVEVKYDLRALVRDICNSYTYQMSTQPRNETVTDKRNFAYQNVRRLGAEQLLDAIAKVTESKVKFPVLPLGANAVQVADGNSGNYFLGLFGRPARSTVCTCERRAEPTLAQVLHLINGDTMTNALNASGGRLEKLASSQLTPAQMAEDIWLAAYSRTPTTDEQAYVENYVNTAADKKVAIEDVMWSVLNSKEFVFNH
ncbi:MAG: DUF1549 domain-containing protein [Candidatus Hydrogenedentes bacterium]|nr:DUF1549 domain-containing protein [Candidatus Hydrogenedentota bacterium]